MAEDKDNKTEPATPRRRQEARESGQVARSADLTAAVLLLVGLYVISYTATSIVQLLASVMAWFLSANAAGAGGTFSTDAHRMFENDFRVNAPQIAKIVVPIMLAVAGAAILAVGMQVGF